MVGRLPGVTLPGARPTTKERMAKRRASGSISWRAFVAAISGVATTLALIYALNFAVQKRADDRARNETLRVASAIRAQIEQDLTATIHLQKGLAAFYATNPDMTYGEFEAFAGDLMLGARHVRNLGFSRGTVIAEVFPLVGNEPALGVDYRSLPGQWPAIERAITSRSSVLAGPTRLVQGGMALIGRTPVFRSPPGGQPSSGEFLGLVSVVVNVESLLARLGVSGIEETQRIALRGVDGRGADGAGFYGDPALFDTDAAVLDIFLPGGSWQLAVAARPGAASLPPELSAARWLGIVAALLAGLVTLLVVRYVEQGRRARLRVAESEARFRDFAESSADWFWETDADHRFVWISLQSESVIGVPPASFIGKTCYEFAGGDPSEPAWQQHLRDLDQRRPFRDLVFQAETPRGRRWIRASGVPVMAPDGHLRGYRGSASDITEREEERTRLAEALQQAEAASSAKSAFLAQMSHELRTPLNAIIGFAELISGQVFGPAAGERYRAYAGDILSSGRHLLALVNDLLDLGRIEAGDLRIQPEEADLAALVREGVGMISASARKAGLDLEVELQEGLPKLVADPRAVVQILVSLMTNAVKFTPAGGRVRVSARVEESGEMLVSVADTGVGIDPEDVGRLLRPFEQVEDTFARARGGAGLGLPISLGLMRLHGGMLAIESHPGAGTTVICRFPASRIRRARTRLVAS